MAAAYRAVIADRKDLIIVTVVCPNSKCGAQTSFDIEREYPATEPRNHGRIPHYCASCEVAFPEEIVKALGGLATFHRSGRAAEEKAGKTVFQFEILEPEGE